MAMKCHIDDQECAGPECTEWDSPVCAERRSAREAIAPFLAPGCNLCEGPLDWEKDLGRICAGCRNELAGMAR